MVCATDGEDVVRQLGTMTPDLLLIDLQMPRLDGVGLIRRLKEIAPGRHYPLFVLTSHISGQQAAEARAAGADAVFTKPVQTAALAAAFRARRGDRGRSTPFVGDGTDEVVVPLLDPVTFGELVSMMGTDVAASLVVKFEDTMRTDLSALMAGKEADDPIQVSDTAHRCFGLCHIMGATAIAGRLNEMEKAAAEGDMKSVRSLLDGTVLLLDATLRYMRAALQRADV